MSGADGLCHAFFKFAGYLAGVDVAAFQDLGQALLFGRPDLGLEPGNTFVGRCHRFFFLLPEEGA